MNLQLLNLFLSLIVFASTLNIKDLPDISEDEIPENHKKIYDKLIKHGVGSNYKEIVNIRKKLKILNNIARAEILDHNFNRSDPNLFNVSFNTDPILDEFLVEGDMLLSEEQIDDWINGYLTEPRRKLRLCSCDEVEECKQKAANEVDECKVSCHSQLRYFGITTGRLTTCFPNFVEEAVSTFKCLQEKVPGFCAENYNYQISSPSQNYTAYTQGYTPKEDKDDGMNQMELVKKARNVFVELKKFKSCVEICYKKHTINCYDKKQCAIALPSKNAMDTIFDECHTYKNAIHLNAMKSCHCLALKQDVKNILGVCGLLASPHFMRNI